jgi:hypothetical protein
MAMTGPLGVVGRHLGVMAGVLALSFPALAQKAEPCIGASLEVKRGGAIKADLEVIPAKARAIVESLGHSLVVQNAAAKKSLGEAVTYLEATGSRPRRAGRATASRSCVAVPGACNR